MPASWTTPRWTTVPPAFMRRGRTSLGPFCHCLRIAARNGEIPERDGAGLRDGSDERESRVDAMEGMVGAFYGLLGVIDF